MDFKEMKNKRFFLLMFIYNNIYIPKQLIYILFGRRKLKLILFNNK